MRAGFFFLFVIVFSLSGQAEDLSCEPIENDEQVDRLVNALTRRFDSQGVSRSFCAQMNRCYRSGDEGEFYEDEECGDPFTSTDFRNELSASQGNCNLSRQERVALYNYMGGLYSCLNRSLYTNNSRQFSSVISSLNNALRRFPKYEGFVFRGATLPQSILNRHKVGESITYEAFTSTSTERSMAEGFGDHHFLIYSKTGRPVMGLDTGEHEVLFQAGTRFRVIRAENNKFIMREVTGRESSSQARAEDKRVLDLAQAALRNNSGTQNARESQDVWSCPLDNTQMPKLLRQRSVPNVSGFLPAANTQ